MRDRANELFTKALLLIATLFVIVGLVVFPIIVEKKNWFNSDKRLQQRVDDAAFD